MPPVSLGVTYKDKFAYEFDGLSDLGFRIKIFFDQHIEFRTNSGELAGDPKNGEVQSDRVNLRNNSGQPVPGE